MEPSFTEKLQAIHVEALVGQARVIRDHPPSAERTEQSERYVRQAVDDAARVENERYKWLVVS